MEIKDLITKLEDAYVSEKNQLRLSNNADIKFKNGIGRPVYTEIFGYSMVDYFNNPELCLRSQLEWKLYQYNEIDDDFPLDMKIGSDFAVALEASLFGMDYALEEGKEVSYLGSRIKSTDDLEELVIPDFYSSGIMPKIHEMNKQMSEIADGRIEIVYPDWARGVWSSANILRGFNELFMDTIDNPEYAHRLLQFIVDARIGFENQRCKFLGIAPQDKNYQWKYVFYRNCGNSEMFEDEIDGNMFSVDLYKEFIWPYQKQLSDYYDGISYFHSCGNLTPFLEEISKLDIQYMMHVSPWTDYKKAAEVIPDHIILQRSLHPTDDIIYGDEQHIRRLVKSIIEESKGRKVEIWADAIYEGGQATVNKIKMIANVFKEFTK